MFEQGHYVRHDLDRQRGTRCYRSLWVLLRSLTFNLTTMGIYWNFLSRGAGLTDMNLKNELVCHYIESGLEKDLGGQKSENIIVRLLMDVAIERG